MTQYQKSRLDVQGHRGARGLLPENTLPAFKRAIEIGVDTLELDCAVTKDLVVVVSHDSALNPDITRNAAGEWLVERGPPIWRLTYDELQRYDVGRVNPASDYARRFPQQQAVDGARIPRLADVFALVKQSGRDVRFNMETKVSPLDPKETAPPETFVEAMLGVIRESDMKECVAIQSFDWRTLALVHKRAPKIETVYLTAEQDWMDNVWRDRGKSPWTASRHVSEYGGSLPKMISAAGGAVWSPYFHEATHEVVDEAHGLGLRVVVWTVNEERDIKQMIEVGVDGIISDYPDLLLRVARAPQ